MCGKYTEKYCFLKSWEKLAHAQLLDTFDDVLGTRLNRHNDQYMQGINDKQALTSVTTKAAYTVIRTQSFEV